MKKKKEFSETSEEIQVPKVNVVWVLGKKIFNLGKKVYRDGDSLNGMEIDEYGFPLNSVLKKAHELGFLKLKE